MRRSRLRIWLAGLAVLALLGLVTLAVVHQWVNSPRADSLPFQTGFESGDLADYRRQGDVHISDPSAAQAVESPVREGRYAMRMALDRDSPKVRDSRRSELRLRCAEIGKQYRYSFSLFIPEDWQPSPVRVVAAQWHSVPDLLRLERWRPPPLRFSIVEERLELMVRWDPDRVTRTWLSNQLDLGVEDAWSAPLLRGQWCDWSFRVRWSFGEDGFLELHRNDELLLSRKGPNCYNDSLGPYLKIGVYVPLWGQGKDDVVDRRVLIFDAVEVVEIL